MAKKRAAKAPAEAATAAPPPTAPPAVLDPQRVHELFGLPAPLDPPKAPPPVPGYLAVWDPGASVLDVRRRHPHLFHPADWFDKEPFARASDRWQWRQVRLAPVEVGKPFDEQVGKLSRGDEVASAREVVVYLALVALTTGVPPETVRLRCRDTLPSGRRVCVGPFHPTGLELVNVADQWASPGIGLAAVFTPKKK